MNNVTTEDICPCIPLPKSSGVGSNNIIAKRDRKQKFLSIMKIGKPYRPNQFKDLPISEYMISKYLNELDDEGFVDRVVTSEGRITWTRTK